MSREGKIVKNAVIYTIGNFGTKVLSYIMMLVYTHYIVSAELGYFDVVVSTISMLQPIVLLMLDDGIYRWLIDEHITDKQTVISTCLKTIIFTSTFAVLLFLPIGYYLNLPHTVNICFYAFTTFVYSVVLSAVRGLTNNKLYAASGVINCLFLLVFEVIGLMVLHLQLEVLFAAKSIAIFITLFVIRFKQPEFVGVLKKRVDREQLMSILRYTLPLIPNAICWWVVNSSDRYIILYFLDASANGIYTISNKFPTIVTAITGIVYFSVQESFLKEYNSKDRDEFYSKIFRKYYCLLFGLVLCGIPATRIIIELFTGTEYTTAWKYTGFLFLSIVFQALSALLGIGYQIARETKRSVFSTVGAAALNFIVNVLLISKFGLHAASFSTFIAYLFLFIIRIYHSKKYFTLKIKWLEMIGFVMASLGVSALTLFIKNVLWCFLIVIPAIVFVYLYNKEMINKILAKIIKR